MWKYRDRKVLAFHLTLGRLRPEEIEAAELEASRRVVAYMRDHGAHMGYEESFHALDDPLRHVHPHFAVCSYIGVILRRRPDVVAVAYGNIAVDLTHPGARQRFPAGRKIVQAISGRTDVEMLEPFIDLSKHEVRDTLPPDLLALTFSCFMPVKDGEEWRVCGKCQKCGEVLA